MTLAIGVAAGLFLTVAGIRLLENSFIYFPPRFPDGFPPPELYGRHVEDVWLTTLARQDSAGSSTHLHSSWDAGRGRPIFHGAATFQSGARTQVLLSH